MFSQQQSSSYMLSKQPQTPGLKQPPATTSPSPDLIKRTKQLQEQKAIQTINKQKFQKEWLTKVRGPSLANYQYTVISQALYKTMLKAKDLVHASRQLAEMLGYELGYQYWNVIIVNGPFSKKTYASGGYFVVFERMDGMQAIIWLNKLGVEL